MSTLETEPVVKARPFCSVCGERVGAWYVRHILSDGEVAYYCMVDGVFTGEFTEVIKVSLSTGRVSSFSRSGRHPA